MEKLDFLSDALTVARMNQRQLRVTMNLPVRLVSENQILDVVPIPEEDRPLKLKSVGALLSRREVVIYPTPDELITFFKDCKQGDLVTRMDLSIMFQVSKQTIDRLAGSGLLKRYRISSSLSLYKLSELPEVITKM